MTDQNTPNDTHESDSSKDEEDNYENLVIRLEGLIELWENKSTYDSKNEQHVAEMCSDDIRSIIGEDHIVQKLENTVDLWKNKSSYGNENQRGVAEDCADDVESTLESWINNTVRSENDPVFRDHDDILNSWDIEDTTHNLPNVTQDGDPLELECPHCKMFGGIYIEVIVDLGSTKCTLCNRKYGLELIELTPEEQIIEE